MWFLNLSRERKPAPKLPNDLAALNKLANRHFTLVERKQNEGEGHGGESVCWMVVKCPLCGFHFDAVERSGCFHSSMTPENCPNCNFPKSLLNAVYAQVNKPDSASKEEP
jgi:hypothetical protein